MFDVRWFREKRAFFSGDHFLARGFIVSPFFLAWLSRAIFFTSMSIILGGLILSIFMSITEKDQPMLFRGLLIAAILALFMTASVTPLYSAANRFKERVEWLSEFLGWEIQVFGMVEKEFLEACCRVKLRSLARDLSDMQKTKGVYHKDTIEPKKRFEEAYRALVVSYGIIEDVGGYGPYFPPEK